MMPKTADKDSYFGGVAKAKDVIGTTRYTLIAKCLHCMHTHFYLLGDLDTPAMYTDCIRIVNSLLYIPV